MKENLGLEPPEQTRKRIKSFKIRVFHHWSLRLNSFILMKERDLGPESPEQKIKD